MRNVKRLRRWDAAVASYLANRRAFGRHYSSVEWMVDISQSPLGMPDSNRFSERRGTHAQGTRYLLPALLHRHRLQIRARRRHHVAPRQSMDGAKSRAISPIPKPASFASVDI
jgi:hypothetical protein